MLTLSVLLSFVAICISCVALWKGHFARFSPLALAGNLQHRVYPIRSGDERWFIPSFHTSVSVTNPGARPGIVTGLRLRFHYPELPFPGNHEFVYPNWELKPDKLNCIGKDRFSWIDEVVAADWSPFVVLPKATVTKHLLFEARWESPVIQKRIIATLELQADWRAEWLAVDEWKVTLDPNTWVDLEGGRAMVYSPGRGQVANELECSPPDLHKYTGTKAALPTEGALSAMEPSSLDYPKPKQD